MNENFWVAIVLLTRIRSIQAGSRGTPDVGIDRDIPDLGILRQLMSGFPRPNCGLEIFILLPESSELDSEPMKKNFFSSKILTPNLHQIKYFLHHFVAKPL